MPLLAYKQNYPKNPYLVDYHVYRKGNWFVELPFKILNHIYFIEFKNYAYIFIICDSHYFFILK